MMTVRHGPAAVTMATTSIITDSALSLLLLSSQHKISLFLTEIEVKLFYLT